MKVFITLMLVIASVSARGSGPYLPRGWKPDGPAFYLPSEVSSSPAPAPVQVSLLQETEASGSDAFKEYGPPKLDVVSISVNQILPDVATEQTFLTEVKNNEVVAAVNVEAKSLQSIVDVEEVSTATESQVAIVEQAIEEVTELSDVDQTAENSEAVQLEEVKEEIAPTEVLITPTDAVVEDIVVPTAVAEEIVVPTVTAEEGVVSTAEAEELVIPTAAAEEVVVPTATAEEIVVPTAAVEEAIVPIALEQEAVVPTAAEQEVVVAKTGEQEGVVVPLAQQELVQESTPVFAEVVEENVAEGVSNIAEALVHLEKEIKAAEVQAIAKVAEITSLQETGGPLPEAPEGFLEYGPPGFAEYGPPKQEDLARFAVQEASANAGENNEVRRRRFSPKLRATKKH